MPNSSQAKFQDQPMTIAYIRNEVRNNRYIGDMFEALKFMLAEYDTVNSRLKLYTKPTEYNIVNEKDNGFMERIDVV